MQRIFYLSTCDTCRDILRRWQPDASIPRQDIKTDPLSPEQADELARLAGSYEALFSRRAQLYKQLGLAKQTLGEADFRRYLLEHYTFLRRPVLVLGSQIFIGSEAESVEAAHQALKTLGLAQEP
ncbi:MAG: ArsC/Spx/MgsR family protein [Bacteroidia bacterium]|nr:ArsC/Spx/MgsR family protein [Bacteroidia bacterium]